MLRPSCTGDARPLLLLPATPTRPRGRPTTWWGSKTLAAAMWPPLPPQLA